MVCFTEIWQKEWYYPNPFIQSIFKCAKVLTCFILLIFVTSPHKATRKANAYLCCRWSCWPTKWHPACVEEKKNTHAQSTSFCKDDFDLAATGSLLVFTGLKDYRTPYILKQQRIQKDFIFNFCLFPKSSINVIWGYEIHSAKCSAAKWVSSRKWALTVETEWLIFPPFRLSHL